MYSDEEIAALEREHPDVLALPPRKPKVIWTKDEGYFTDDCDFMMVWEGDCEHPSGWHSMPTQVRTCELGLAFEIKRRRPDGEPGEDWSPMTPEERRSVMAAWMRERLAELLHA